MKKKIFGAVIIAAMALAAGWNFNQSKNEVALSDLALANVEALASGEGGYTRCYVYYTEGFSSGYLVMDCNTCSLRSADFWGGDYYCTGWL